MINRYMMPYVCVMAAATIAVAAVVSEPVALRDVPLDAPVSVGHLTNLTDIASRAGEFRAYTNAHTIVTNEVDPAFSAWDAVVGLRRYDVTSPDGVAVCQGYRLGSRDDAPALSLGGRPIIDLNGHLAPDAILGWGAKQAALAPTNGIVFGSTLESDRGDWPGFSWTESLQEIRLDDAYVERLAAAAARAELGAEIAAKQDPVTASDGVVKTGNNLTLDKAVVADTARDVTAEVTAQWEQASVIVSNGMLQVSVVSNGADVVVWSSDSVASSDIEALRAEAAVLMRRIEALEGGGGASTWNHYAADGTDNPEPANMTMLNAPSTIFGAGFSWESSGAYAVLTQSGSVAFATGADGGEFRIGPNKKDYFGFALGGTVTVGARCGSINIDEAAGVARMSYDYAGGAFPTLWYAPKIGVDFVQQDGVVWVDNGDGSATVSAPLQGSSGFWHATSEKKIDSIFKASMPARFDGGILGGMHDLPVIYNDIIVIEQGGRHYRIPVEEVR